MDVIFSEVQVFYRVEYTLKPPSHEPVNENLSIKPCLRLQKCNVSLSTSNSIESFPRQGSGPFYCKCRSIQSAKGLS